jgi:hypothetical protein
MANKSSQGLTWPEALVLIVVIIVVALASR